MPSPEKGNYTNAAKGRRKAGQRNRAVELRKTAEGRRRVEIEVKVRVEDRGAIQEQLRRLKAIRGRRVHEMNTLWDKPDGSLLREGKMVRVRIQTAAPARARRAAGSGGAGETVLLTYKGPQRAETAAERRYKIREEHEVRVQEGTAVARILEGVGLQPRFRYEKYRTTYRLRNLKGLLIELDETPIGDFVELEGPAKAIDRAAALLGFDRKEYITKSYGALFAERAGQSGEWGVPGEAAASRDMLFPPGP